MPDETLTQDRKVLAEIAVIALMAVAFHESLNSFRESLDQPGFPVGPFEIFVIFFLTMLRFFIGNHLHLRKVTNPSWWKVDFFVVLAECAVFGFLGSVSPFISQNHSSIRFVWVLAVLYAVDVLWILCQGGRCNWKKGDWAWRWALLNTGLLIVMGVLYSVYGDLNDPGSLFWLAVINGCVAFVIDPWLIYRF